MLPPNVGKTCKRCVPDASSMMGNADAVRGLLVVILLSMSEGNNAALAVLADNVSTHLTRGVMNHLR